jgi:endonuclease/exonuclease/phosphatase family metal-dependent hydrolase
MPCQRPYSDDFSLWSWNARGLFGADHCKARKKQDKVRWASQNFDVVFVQEAHCGDHLEDDFLHEFKLTHRCWTFEVTGNHAAGGLLIFCKLSFISKFTFVEEVVIDPGRIAGVSLKGNAGELKLFNVHVEPRLKMDLRIDRLSQLRNACGCSSTCRCVIAGDFNFVLAPEDRYRPALKQFSGQRQPDGTYFLDNFRDFVEAWQSDYTRRGGQGTDIVLSRLDRIYISLGAWETNDFNMRVSAQHDLNVMKNLSDHVPVCARISRKTVGSGTFFRPQIPSWVSKHPCWPGRLEHHLERLEVLFPSMPTAAIGVDAGPPECNIFGAIRKIKAAMHKAAADITNLMFERGAQTASERLFWGCRTLRAFRDADREKVRQGLRAWPKLRTVLKDDAPESWTSEAVDQIADWVRAEALTDLQTQSAEMEATKQLPEYQQTRRRGLLAKYAEKWSTYNRKNGINGVLDAEGNIITEDLQAAHILSDHWQSVFAEKDCNVQLAERFLGKFARKLPPIQWILSESQFMEILGKLADSGAGPDGIRYSAWTRAPFRVRQILYLGYRSWLAGFQLPEDFNYAYLCLLAKGQNPEGEAQTIRAPENTRPLSLANSDGKIFAVCLKESLESPVSYWASEEQAGFIKDRRMLKNIVDVELAGATLSAEAHNEAAMVFFDYAAAFPSIAHAFLWVALEYLGVPLWVIAALKNCYKGCWHWLRHGRSCVKALVIAAGVKQGCPLSPLLFVIVTDPFLCAMRSLLNPRSLVRAYADDICVVLCKLWLEGPTLAKLFRLYELISCLSLKPRKCVVVPLGNYQDSQILKMLTDLIPSWKDFKICDAALYLGLWIGPGAKQKSWETALSKFHSRLDTILRFEAGVWISCLLYRVFAFSTLAFVAQAQRIPEEALKAEKKAIFRILRGPRHWISLPAAFQIDVLFGMPSAFPSLQSVGLASKVRLVLSDFPDLKAQLQQFEDALLDNSDTIMACLGRGNWWDNSMPFVLRDALREAADLGILGTFDKAEDITALSLPKKERNKHLQKAVVAMVSSRVQLLSPETFFCMRFGRWNDLLDGGASKAASQVPALLVQIKGKVPPAVLAAWMHTALNGWCTARRFQSQGRCRLSRDCHGDDSLEHYARCRHAWSCTKTRLKLAATPRTMTRFLGLGAESAETAILLCVQQAAVYHAFNRLRAVGRRAAPGETQQLIEARIRTLGALCRPLGQILRRIWVRTSSDV